MVERHKEEFGLNRCLRALGVSKGTWHYHQVQKRENARRREAEEARLRERVVEVIEDHPAYGYRRILPELQARWSEAVNHKRLRRLLGTWDLSLRRRVSVPKPSGIREVLRHGQGQLNLVKGWEPAPLEMLSTDFTELRYAGGREKAYLMVMLDPASEWAPGWAVGESANRELALRCWEKTRQRLGAVGRGAPAHRSETAATAGLVVHSDQDTVYTSYDWLRALIVESGVVVSFSENGAKENPWEVFSKVVDRVT